MNRDIINTQEDQGSIKGIALQSLFAGFAGIILAFIILCCISMYLFFNPISADTIYLISMFSKYFCAIIAAFIACANRRTKGYLRGLSGALTFILLGGLFFTLFAPTGFVGKVFLIDLIICSMLGILSGAVAVNLNAKRKK